MISSERVSADKALRQTETLGSSDDRSLCAADIHYQFQCVTVRLNYLEHIEG
jgi:hypothetical protein